MTDNAGAARVIANYEALAALTARMHSAATTGEWQTLIDIEQERGRLVAAMKPLDAATPLDDDARNRKQALIGAVLAQDGEIRDAVRAWMEELRLDMQSGQQELRLLKEYGA